MSFGDGMTPMKPGDRVNYHGSLAEYHGTGTILSVDNHDHSTVKSDDGHRYVIRLDRGFPLYNVRRQSFSEHQDEVLARSE